MIQLKHKNSCAWVANEESNRLQSNCIGNRLNLVHVYQLAHNFQSAWKWICCKSLCYCLFSINYFKCLPMLAYIVLWLACNCLIDEWFIIIVCRNVFFTALDFKSESYNELCVWCKHDEHRWRWRTCAMMSICSGFYLYCFTFSVRYKSVKVYAIATFA